MDADLQAATELVRQVRTASKSSTDVPAPRSPSPDKALKALWAQANQQRIDTGDAQGDHEFLIWEDRGAGPTAAFDEESEEEDAGPAATLLADSDAHDASSSEAADSSDEDEAGPAGEESEEEDGEAGPGEELHPGRSADEDEPTGRGVLAREDGQPGPLSGQVGTLTQPLLLLPTRITACAVQCSAAGEGIVLQVSLCVIGQDASTAQKRPVWEDEEDEAVEVNIAGRNRLRKLRQTEEETVVTGTVRS